MIAISYRRDDSKAAVGRIFDRLATDIGRDQIFLDFDSIPLGVDFREHIQGVWKQCHVILIVIGPRWSGQRGDATRRLDDPTDLVRIEVETALTSGLPVIPILLDDTMMPSLSELPDSLHSLVFRNALDLDTGKDFHHHIDRLVGALRNLQAVGLEKRAAAAKQKAIISIITTPPGAMVLDMKTGGEMGTTPINDLSLDPGEIDWRMVKDGYESFRHFSTLTAGVNEPTVVELARQLAVVSIETIPSGAIITDLKSGREIGTSPIAKHKLEPGRIKWLIKKTGYQSVRHEQTLVAGTNAPVSIVLIELAIVSITATPVGAVVTDAKSGNELGITPLDSQNLKPGEYQWVFSKKGYENAFHGVTLVAGENPPITANLVKLEASVSIWTTPSGATIKDTTNAKDLGTTPIIGLKIDAGAFRWQISKQGYESLEHSGTFVAGENYEFSVSLSNLLTATKKEPFVNSLGMKFVPVPLKSGPTSGIRVMFAIWETRVKDYSAYAAAMEANNQPIDMNWKDFNQGDYHQGPDEPVVNLKWEEARAFCTWLTMEERKAGLIGAHDQYRLPTDHEWSCAAGIGEKEDPSASPKKKSGQIDHVYPWGTDYPPLTTAGNYNLNARPDKPIFTTPVGSFPENEYGLFDMGGNVWEWCEDCVDKFNSCKVLRGASWRTYHEISLRTSFRADDWGRDNSRGFRVVLQVVPISEAALIDLSSAKRPNAPKSRPLNPLSPSIPETPLRPTPPKPVKKETVRITLRKRDAQ